MEDKARMMVETAIANEEKRMADVQKTLEKTFDKMNALNEHYNKESAALQTQINTLLASIEGGKKLVERLKNKLNN